MNLFLYCYFSLRILRNLFCQNMFYDIYTKLTDCIELELFGGRSKYMLLENLVVDTVFSDLVFSITVAFVDRRSILKLDNKYLNIHVNSNYLNNYFR